MELRGILFLYLTVSFLFYFLGLSVGLLDVDICGPSIPRMLGLEGQEVHQSASGWSPVYVTHGIDDRGDTSTVNHSERENSLGIVSRTMN